MTIDKYDKTNQPKISKVKIKNVPQELKKLNQWTCWRYVFKGGKWTKPPCDPHGNIWDHHQSDLTFKKALKAHKKNPELGIGISMRSGDNICGIDIDPGPDGKIPKALKKAIKSCPSYSEVSPSGIGYRIFGIGSIPTHGSKKGSFVETYDHGRYLTVTGDANGAAGKPLVDLTEVAGWMISKFGGSAKDATPPLSGSSTGSGGILAVKPTDYSEMLKGISPDGYQDWIEVGMALHHEYGGSADGFRIWDSWSRGSEKYAGIEESEKKWNSFGKGSGEKATGLKIRYLYEQYGGQIHYDEPAFKPFLEVKAFGGMDQDMLSVDLMPPDLRAAVKEVSRFVKTSDTLIITSLLGIFSACLAKRIRVVERGGLKHQCSLGFFMGIPTGGRKSGIDHILMRPFTKFERAERKAWRDRLPKVEAMIKTLKGQIAFANKRIRAGASGEELDDLTDEIAEYEAEIMRINQPAPRLSCSDITEEELSNLMADNYETMFIQSDEGRNIIKNIVGRYSNSEAMSLYLHGLTGSTYQRDRVTAKKAVDLEKPCINMMVKVQKDSFLDLVSDSRFQESGMAARLFLSVHDIEIFEQVRTRGEADLNIDALRPMDDLVYQLMESTHALTRDGQRKPGKVNFELSEAAVELYHDFNDEYSDLLKSGRWKGLEDITNKIASRALVLAALLSVLWKPQKYIRKLEKSREVGSIQRMEISAAMYKKGVHLAKILTEQTVKVLGFAQEESENKEANRIVTGIMRDVVVNGLHGGEDGSFPQSIVSQKMAANKRQEWREYLTRIIGAGYFIEVPGSPGKFRLSQQAIKYFKEGL